MDKLSRRVKEWWDNVGRVKLMLDILPWPISGLLTDYLKHLFDWLSNFDLWCIWVIAGALLFLLFDYLYGFGKRARGPRLSVEVLPKVDLDHQNLKDISAYTLSVWNAQEKRQTIAHKVKVSVTFEHVDGEVRRSTGLWLVEDEGRSVTWKRRISIGTSKFKTPLFYWVREQTTLEFRPLDADDTNINPYGILIMTYPPAPLLYGQWKITVTLSGDNVAETTWRKTLTLRPDAPPTT
jgi:hypothetical protein